MAISSPKPHNKMKDPLSPSRSPKSPSIRINGAQINGQTCHQCRQKTMKLVASCKNTARAKGACPIKFCDKCLLNRYGENAEEMMKLGDWKCPKCRDICNCSICMKKKGQQPTGMLVHAAKATGFSSVMEMLHTKGPDGLGVVEILKDTCTHLNKTIVSSKVLNLNKGQGESVLRELIHARVTRRGVYSANIQFHIKLLSLLQKDKGEVSPLSYSANIGSSWLQILGKCISESQFAPKELHLGCLTKGTDAYDKLGSSEKLRILNLLCDEMLGTNCVRTYIEEQHAKYVESKREEKSKIQAAKEKEKLMKQKLKDKVAQIVLSSREGAPLSISEHENLVSKIKADTQKVHAEMVEAKDMVPKKKQRLDAVRTEPLLLDQNGRAYWKLRSHSDGSHILLQDIGNQDLVTPQDKWFIYDDEQEKAVQNYISTTREKRHRKRLIPIAMGSDGTNLKVQLPW
eukprot:TRINITY_DN29595_c0_g1_i5.p1 TRINITY_DN29595_c0_g1~~TRINITY_DN29595_c0_g1_i5.p1  ORF type:complete len:465 (-),score=96.49 TRINITY_DN29595_c0_g1_i5:296-1669(-)